MKSVIEKMSNHDLHIAVQCMNFILNSGHYYPEEIGTRLGVDRPELVTIHSLLQRFLSGEADIGELASYSEKMLEDIDLAIHNSFADVGFAEEYDDSELIQGYGISRSDVEAAFERLHAVEESEDMIDDCKKGK